MVYFVHENILMRQLKFCIVSFYNLKLLDSIQLNMSYIHLIVAIQIFNDIQSSNLEVPYRFSPL